MAKNKKLDSKDADRFLEEFRDKEGYEKIVHIKARFGLIRIICDFAERELETMLEKYEFGKKKGEKWEK